MNFKESLEVSSGELVYVHVIAVGGIVWSSQSGDDMIFVKNFCFSSPKSKNDGSYNSYCPAVGQVILEFKILE